MKQWIAFLFLCLICFRINSIHADSFVLVLPDGEEIRGDVVELNDLVSERFRRYFEQPWIQKRLIATYKLVEKEMPKFHELFYDGERTEEEEKEYVQLHEHIVRKYYKQILTDAFAIGGIKFTLIESYEETAYK